MAEPALPRTWRNTYWLLRHGRSLANEQDLIVSHLANGTLPEWGLTTEGQQQAAAAGEQLRVLLDTAKPSAGSTNGRSSGASDRSENGAGADGGHACTPGDVHFLASPFSRALETAQAASQALGRSHELQVRWDGQGSQGLARVWQARRGTLSSRWASTAGCSPPAALPCR